MVTQEDNSANANLKTNLTARVMKNDEKTQEVPTNRSHNKTVGNLDTVSTTGFYILIFI